MVERLIAQQALEWPEIRRLMTVSGAERDRRCDSHRRRRTRRPVWNLHLDAHAKMLSSALLKLEIEVPEEVAPG